MQEAIIPAPWWFELLVVLASGVGVIAALAWKIARPHLEKYVMKVTSPMAKRVDNLESNYADLDSKKTRDYARFMALEKQNKAILKALLVILLHQRDGNHTGETDKVIRELQESIIDS